MRGKGINYDTGARLSSGWTREAFDSATARREMRVIASDLHCTAVRISGSDPDRLTLASEHAANAGLEVWFSPFPCELTTDQMLPLFADCAARAERLRRHGAEVVLVTGGELSIFAHGFLPGDDLFARIAHLTTPGPRPRPPNAVPTRLNAFLGEVVDTVRGRFAGKLTYAALLSEGVDWTPFDYVGVDAYRAAHNAATFPEQIRDLHRHGRPVAVTEFGCCTYRGAADRGGRGWMIIDRGHEPVRLDGDYERNEDEQATYLRELLDIFEQENVDSAFWFTFAGYNYPHRADRRRDLDLASYGVITLGPDATWRPKTSFHALAARYATSNAR